MRNVIINVKAEVYHDNLLVQRELVRGLRGGYEG